jgi:hypothetical protein
MTSHCNDSTLKGVIKPHCNNFSYHRDAVERSDRRKITGASCVHREPRPGFTEQGTMVYSDELLAVAKRIFCFGTPEKALEFPIRFLTYAMTYASDEDIEILRKYFTDDEFKVALDDPAPGIFDQRSWVKWNQHYGRTPVPPLPKRRIPGVDPATVPDFFPPKS